MELTNRMDKMQLSKQENNAELEECYMDPYREIYEQKLKNMNEILHQISCMDQAEDETGLNAIIPHILKAIGEYINAERVYIFDWISEAHNSFQNTFEWCADGVAPQIQTLQYIPLEEMPVWLDRFRKKKNIVIYDVEDIAEEMPQEYARLKPQNIHTLIAVPVYSNQSLTGFIGVDNPKLSTDDILIQLLSNVGGHLGSVRENMRMQKVLEKEQENLEDSLKELKKEKSILDVLSIDYTSVYTCDLLKDTMIAVKQEEDTNAAITEHQIASGFQSFSFRIQYYFEHFVIRESAPDFMEKLSADYLIEYLGHHDRFAYRFRCYPSPAGKQHFEVQIVRLKNVPGFQVVMGYRYIDDIVAEQERQKLKLERALTEANRSRKQLEQQMTMVQNIHKALTSGAWNLLYNEAGELVEVNWSDTLRHMLGFTSIEDFPNTFETWSDRLHPEDKKRTLDAYEQVMADRTGKKNFDVEYRILSKEGEYHWFRATGYLSRRKDGSPQSFDGVFVNKDEKHATDEKLHQALKKAQEARNELLLEHEIISAVSRLYFSVYRIDLQTDFYEEISSDQSVHRLTGHEGKAQKKLYELCDSIVAEEYRKVVRRFFQLSTVADRLAKTDTVEIEYLASDGNWHQARFIEKKRDENGRVTRILYLTRIVSQEKQRELEQQRLQIAYQVAENANEAKTTFLLNMSHDIRTPMNAILGFSGLMRERLTDPELLHYQEMIDESGKLLLSIINNVLDMARIESGKVELNENCNTTGDIISGVCKVFAAEAEKKNIQLVHKTQIVHRYILCDVTKIQEIFTNLISNAVKYTPDGGKITVTTTELPGDEPGYIRVKSVVEDTGIGMSKEFLPHIFELFSRERNTTSGKIPGTGLGMQIVKRLVDLMQGTIEVSSELGKGSCFIVTIPHKIADERYYEKAELQEVKESPRDFSGKRILLAEDNELNAEIAIAILSEAGLVIERAEDGIICVNKLEQNPAGTYDLILMDIQMPNMDGYQATQIIRQLPEKEKANIPIVAMTANAFEEDKKKALEKGMNGHIAKPIDVEKIETVLLNILG